MSTLLATRPQSGVVRIGLADGVELEVDFETGKPVGVYLSDAGQKVGDGQTAVIDGQPVDPKTIVPENAAVAVMNRPKNG